MPIFEQTKMGAGVLHDIYRHVSVRPSHYEPCMVRGGRYSSQPIRHLSIHVQFLLRQAGRLRCCFWVFVLVRIRVQQLLKLQQVPLHATIRTDALADARSVSSQLALCCDLLFFKDRTAVTYRES